MIGLRQHRHDASRQGDVRRVWQTETRATGKGTVTTHRENGISWSRTDGEGLPAAAWKRGPGERLWKRPRRWGPDSGWGEPRARAAGWGPLYKVLHNLFESSLSQPVCRFHHPRTLGVPETNSRSLIAEMQPPDNYFENTLEHTPK